MTELKIPTPHDLDHAPELAVLVALDAVLGAAEFAVVAVHPPMRDAGDATHDDVPDSYWVASVFITLAGQLHQAIRAYRETIMRENEHESLDDEGTSF